MYICNSCLKKYDNVTDMITEEYAKCAQCGSYYYCVNIKTQYLRPIKTTVIVKTMGDLQLYLMTKS